MNQGPPKREAHLTAPNGRRAFDLNHPQHDIQGVVMGSAIEKS